MKKLTNQDAVVISGGCACVCDGMTKSQAIMVRNEAQCESYCSCEGYFCEETARKHMKSCSLDPKDATLAVLIPEPWYYDNAPVNENDFGGF